MLQTLKRFKQTITLGGFVSIVIHAVLLALLVFGLPQLRLDPGEPEVVRVELVLPEEAAPQEQSDAPAAEPESDTEETASADEADTQPPQLFRPVYRYGEEDAGQDTSVDSDAASEDETDTASSEEPTETPETLEQTVDALEAPTGEALPEAADAPPEPAQTAETAPSPHDTESPVATTAMNATPRGIRAGTLCVSELRRQLNGSVPPYWPDLLPTYRLDEGTILQVRRGAFRSNARWFNLRFRCEIDEAATRIVSFDFTVGTPIPRAEWAGRGLPAS